MLFALLRQRRHAGSRSGSHDRVTRRFRPQIESLESRRLLSTTLYVDPSGMFQGHPAFTHIQDAVTAAATLPPGMDIKVAPGTYVEQVIIPAADKGLTLEAVKPLAAVIKAPATMTGTKAIVEDMGARDVTLKGFTITGPGGAPGSIGFGVRIDTGGSATVTRNHITKIEDNPLSGSQNGIGVYVGQASQATITDNTIDQYQKGGVEISGAGTSAVVDDNTVQGVGPTGVIAQNGITVIAGAAAKITNNDVSDNVYTPPAGGTRFVSEGILLFQPGAVTVSHNTVTHNDVGIDDFQGTGTVIDHNEVSHTTIDGIDLDGVTGATVSHNKVTQSGGDGIALFDNSTGNTVDHNTSSFNAHDGIFVEAGSTNNTISHNKMKGNGNLDAEDDSTGTGTGGTGNTWDHNTGKTDNHGGALLQKGNDHHGNGHDGDDDDNGDDDNGD